MRGIPDFSDREGVNVIIPDYAGEDGNTPDFAKVKTVSDAVYIKKYQEPYGPDSAYGRDADNARAAGLTVGAYLFPNWHSSANSAQAQVQEFRNSPGDVIPHADLPPAVDVEFPGGVAATGRNPADLIEEVRLIVLEIQDQMGVSPTIYSSYNQFYDLKFPAAPWAACCPMWVKTAYRLGAKQPPDTVQPQPVHLGASAADPRDYYRVPDPWAPVGFWLRQIQGDSVGWAGFNHTVDLSVFHSLNYGDHDPLVAWLQKKIGIPVDSWFGHDTQDALKAFQAKNNLTVTGWMDVETFACLAWIS